MSRIQLFRRFLALRPRAALCAWISLWLLHLPLPVVHQHGGRVEGEVWGAGLGEHLSRFHSHDQHAWMPWHVHWVPASDLAHEESHEGDSGSHATHDEEAIVHGPFSPPPVVAMAVNVATLDLPVAEDLAPVLLGEVDCRLAHRQFFDFRASGLEVRALLCVARC